MIFHKLSELSDSSISLNVYTKQIYWNSFFKYRPSSGFDEIKLCTSFFFCDNAFPCSNTLYAGLFLRIVRLSVAWFRNNIVRGLWSFQALNPIDFASCLRHAKFSRHMWPHIPISDLGMPFGLPHFIFNLYFWGLRLPHILFTIICFHHFLEISVWGCSFTRHLIWMSAPPPSLMGMSNLDSLNSYLRMPIWAPSFIEICLFFIYFPCVPNSWYVLYFL